MKNKGLTLKEAVESGMKFRHPCFKEEFWIEHDFNPDLESVHIGLAISSDWEIPEKKITITDSQFWNAVKELKNEHGGISGPDVLFEKLFKSEGT